MPVITNLFYAVIQLVKIFLVTAIKMYATDYTYL